MNNVDALNTTPAAPHPAVASRTARAELDRTARESTPPTRSADRVELSASALDPTYRAAQVARVRAEIDSGSYLTEERLDGAVRALMDQLRSA